LIFDMDGVLIDSEPLWRRAEIELFAEVGVTLSEEDCRRTQGLRIDEVVDWWAERRPWSGRSRQSMARSVVERVAELIREEAHPLPGASRALDVARRRGWRIALASSSPGHLIRAVLERFGWEGAFECTRSAENESHGKPHPAVYLSTAAALGLAPNVCVAIEDSGNGVLSASSAGMRCLAIPDPEAAGDPRFAIATARLDSLERLEEALETLEADREPDAWPSPAHMERTVRAWFEAIAGADREALRALLDPDACWRVPLGAVEPHAGVHRGREEIIDRMLGAVGDAFVAGSQETEIRTLVFGERLTVAEAGMRATTPDGRRYENEYAFFFSFRGERILEIREHVDTRRAAEFFGGEE